MVSIHEVIESYKVFLEVKYPKHSQSYCTRLKNNPESAKAEAVTFSILRSNFDDVKLAEDISMGGADFFCSLNDVKFIIEVLFQFLNLFFDYSYYLSPYKIKEDLDFQYLEARNKSDPSNWLYQINAVFDHLL